MALRDNIISILEKNRGDFVSGQDIANICDVSRSAVAKAIAALKQDGFMITSVNNMGHRLEAECDIVSPQGISAYLDEGVEIRTYKTIDSTNSEAKRIVANGMEKDCILVADHQTSGRGRQGKSFYSPKDTGLYFSAVLHPEIQLTDATGITAATAVAVTKVLKEATKKDPRIKWVNDIFIENRKVCGILTEAITDFETMKVQAVIVGIGINLTTEDFPDELTSVAGCVGRLNRNKLSAEIFNRLKEYCYLLPCRDFMEDYRKYSMVIGEKISFVRNGKEYTAFAKTILDDGSLIVITEDGDQLSLNSGEISIKLS